MCFDKHGFLQKRGHLFPGFILVKIFLLKQVSHSVSHSSRHFELTLIVQGFCQHFVDGLVEILSFAWLYSPLYLYLLYDIVDAIFERLSVHLELVLQHESVD